MTPALDETRAEVARLSGPFPCCVHCQEDPVHAVDRDEHSVECRTCGTGAEARALAAESARRDLVSRLGFGDNVTEPMADNDTVVAWFDEQASEASEWRESQRWRDECALAGHPGDEDCYEHDPARRLEAAESALAAVAKLRDQWRKNAGDDRGIESRVLRSVADHLDAVIP